MQRTRHASLDFPRTHRLSPQEEWCEFLSASMAALTTEDDDDVGSRSLNSIPGLEVRRTGGVFDPLGAERRDEPSALGGLSNGKPLRRESFSESLTSSSGSSPAGAAWRPLGRRASAHVVSTSNQLEHHLEYGGFDIQPFGQANNNTNGNVTKKLPHTSSFRDTLRASSSGSSLVESSSSDEEAAEVIGNTLDNNAFEAPFGVPSLPGLSTLSESSHDLSVDTRTAPVMHVKSPVLSNRKDAQTWQLQDEELLTSPRFGQFRSSLDEAGGSVFGGSMGLFPEDNQVLDARETRTRATKDTRASSVDFTFSRPADLNPPLPPPQEPQLNRLRGRSFSYSAGFGSNNYNPAYVNKQYVPPQQPEFPVTMRQFHAGAPPPPQPTSMLQQGVVRPPRVSIPSNDVQSYHQHQAQPPQYRRYSTDYAAPPYPDHVMPHESDVNPHRTPTGRGMRSYSMEYFQTNQRVRTHSLEGNQMFAPAAPPVEYPVVGRHASGAVTYEWPRSPLGAPPAPPLPPDARVGNGSNNQYPPPPPEAFYEVEFKRGRTELFAGNAGYNPGEYVKVEADRGEDIGRVARRITDISKFTSTSSGDPNSHAEDGMNRPKRHDLPGKKIISVANARECELLSEQRKEEHEVFEVCKSKVRQRLLPMNVIDAEYQFDRHKLTFFFEADRRIDFRELVRDLFAIYKTRIWLQQVVPNGKKSMNELEMMN